MNKSKLIKIFRFIIFLLIIVVFASMIFILPGNAKLYAQGNGIKIFIDAGHGGRDPGAVRYGLREKDANLDIALRLKNKLEANGFIVIMSRTGDEYHSLNERVNMANASQADLFLSIHNNASISPYANGTETYWCSNGVSGSSQFANFIQSNLLSQIGRANRGVKTANFRVIKYTNMPAALVECAFVSNSTEAELLKTEDFREKCATGLFNGINKFAQGIVKSTGGDSGDSRVVTKEFTISIDTPENGMTLSNNFLISGWAADVYNKTPLELAKIEIYNGPDRNECNLLGVANRTSKDISGYNGQIISSSGFEFEVNVELLSKGENLIYIYACGNNNNDSYVTRKVNITDIELPEEEDTNPIANPGGPYKGLINEEITFDGSASSDPDGEIVEYLWDFGDDSTADIVDPTHIYEEAGEYTVTLTVKDNSDISSTTISTTATITEEGSKQANDEFGNVSNSTNMIGYIDITVDDLVKIFEDKNSSKVDRARRIAPIYIQYGKLFNIRVDIAWAQMCHETGFLEYTGDVGPDQNNFVGIGATGGGVPGNSFATEELGIIAHFAHLAWYYYPDHVNEYCNSTYDPRHFGSSHYKYTGDTTLGFLNGRWAPGATYTGKIILFANQVIQGIGEQDPAEEQVVMAEAGEDQNGNVGETITFDASGSTISPISDTTVITYSWDWDGDGEYDETIEETIVSHIFEEAGVYEVGLKVTAFDNIESTDTVTVTVNEIPTANTGGLYEGLAGGEITFDGSGSADSDGEIVEYLWDFGDGSTGTGVSLTHIYNEADTYTVTLIVKDDSDALSTAVSTTATISEDTKDEGELEESVNEIPIANPGDPYEGLAGGEITFDGSRSTDSDGEIIEYLWDFGDGNTGAGVSPTHIYNEADTYTVTLTVVDDSNASSATASTTATISRSAEETEQTVIADAGEDQNGFVGDTLTFDASGSTISPSSETTVTYSWDWNGDGQYDETVQEAVVTHQFNGAGTFTVSLKVTAFDNKTSTDTVTVTISENVNNSPTANPGGPYEGLVGGDITFDGSGSTDNDGELVEYLWDFGDGSTGTGSSVAHTYSTAGTFTISLVVKDDDGASSSAVTTTAVISEPPQVSSVNTVPITNATNVVGYTEVTVDQLVQIFINRGSSKVDWARRIAPIYIQYGKLFDLRADIAWAMMCHETGFFEYTGDVRPDQNNFCGMGAIGGGDPGNSFATEELGIIAQYAHMAWYYYPDHINQYCNSTYDPRHFGSYHYRYTGDTTLGFLNGRWAPGAAYTSKIILFANQIYGF